ncbi:hypothetical protein F2Q70_00028955 [Brassica cretica]|uniref:Proteasome alpha-type subunits domain-containing protein n=1 Tax=Brassica cretica TaxID=69181 RepID=A0A8S9LAP8_BRACR|nr:hypothetical protein F2Q68_00028511 [Brassica cretica]KAF2604464.1 hypothetical protein F2Q70_00028955 [Brassica cretica]
MDQRHYKKRLVLLSGDKGYYGHIENLRRKGMQIVFITPGVPDIDVCADLTGCDSTNCSLSVSTSAVFKQKTNWRCVLTMPFTNKNKMVRIGKNRRNRQAEAVADILVELSLMSLGFTAIGVKTKEGVVLAVEKRFTSPLLEPSSVERIMEIDDHIGCAITGIIADALILVEHGRVETQVSSSLAVSDRALSFGLSSPIRTTSIRLEIGRTCRNTEERKPVDKSGLVKITGFTKLKAVEKN